MAAKRRTVNKPTILKRDPVCKRRSTYFSVYIILTIVHKNDKYRLMNSYLINLKKTTSCLSKFL